MPALVLVWLALVLSLVTGWVMNIIALVAMVDPLETSIGILRVVGIFLPPLGAVMGLFVS